MPEEVHISSLVVHAAPAQLHAVEAAIARLAGARVHATAPSGKLVVTLDASSDDAMLALVQQVQRTAGVFSAALVYQYAGTVEAMNEGLPHVG